MPIRLLVVVVLVAPLGLSGCLWGPETLCSGRETYVERNERRFSGSWCERRRPGDPVCSAGQRARRIESTGRTGCVRDRV